MTQISICIPAFNRANLLNELLDSILNQKFKDYEIVISEDFSPEREEISKIVRSFSLSNPTIKLKYFENKSNLGYDANFRRLIDLSEGEYIFFMGNDDLVFSGGLSSVSRILNKYKDVGVVIRSYATFRDSKDKLEQIFRYSKKELFLPPGPESIAYAFRRSVVASGMVYHRKVAKDLHTDIFDGTLLYQLYLVSKIIEKKSVVFNPDITILYRSGGVPDFGNIEKEKLKFTPKEQTSQSSIYFVKGMLDVASFVGKSSKRTYNYILKDISKYSYPIISIQAHREKKEFLGYLLSLIKLGLGKTIYFYIYALGILFFGKKNMDSFIIILKKIIGFTPKL